MAYGSSNYYCVREQADSKSEKVRAVAISSAEDEMAAQLAKEPWATKRPQARREVPPVDAIHKGAHWYRLTKPAREKLAESAARAHAIWVLVREGLTSDTYFMRTSEPTHFPEDSVQEALVDALSAQRTRLQRR